MSIELIIAFGWAVFCLGFIALAIVILEIDYEKRDRTKGE